MSSAPGETCWTLIRGAAAGRGADRDEFARRYLGAVRSYLGARWRTSPLIHDLDDAVQEVFVACLRDGGALSRVGDRESGPGFRGFLFGVARNIARRFERDHRRGARPESDPGSSLPDDSPALSRVYDRAYARAIMRDVAIRMTERARARGAMARRRVELLRLRFDEARPIREIADAWQVDARLLHREFAKAGREFKAVLREVVGLSERCAPEHLERECDRLLELLA